MKNIFSSNCLNFSTVYRDELHQMKLRITKFWIFIYIIVHQLVFFLYKYQLFWFALSNIHTFRSKNSLKVLVLLIFSGCSYWWRSRNVISQSKGVRKEFWNDTGCLRTWKPTFIRATTCCAIVARLGYKCFQVSGD